MLLDLVLKRLIDVHLVLEDDFELVFLLFEFVVVLLLFVDGGDMGFDFVIGFLELGVEEFVLLFVPLVFL